MIPAIDVVIVTYNSREDVRSCLASIFGAPPSTLARVIVVDNASTDGTVDVVREGFPTVDVTALDRNAGFGAANNIGVRRATAPLVLLLNSDTIVPAGAIDTLAARLAATGAVAAGPKLVDSAGCPELSFGAMLTPIGEFVQQRRGRVADRARQGSASARRALEAMVHDEQTVDWVTGACLLASREAVTAAGLFDERYFMYEEDVDLCAALRARGGTILFTPAATVTHLRGQSTRANPAAGRAMYDRSHVAFYDKHAPAWAPLLRAWLRVRGRAIR
jgi:hypothetical protein